MIVFAAFTGGKQKTHRRNQRWVLKYFAETQPSIAKAQTALRGHVAHNGVEYILAMTGFINVAAL
jgi:hypothetical protein